MLREEFAEACPFKLYGRVVDVRDPEFRRLYRETIFARALGAR